MFKNEVRSIFRDKREAMSITDKMKWDDMLLIQFQTLELPFLDSVLSFYPVEKNNETDTFLITDYLHFKNPNLLVCYPKTVIKKGTMVAVSCHADSIFEENAYNIPEPTDGTIVEPQNIDLVLIPLLGFDLNGNRVGYGKGFYDRYLKTCSKECLKIGLCYFEPVDSVEDASEFDVPLDICITPHRIYVF